MDTLALSQTDTRRLEKLALAAGRTPRAVLKHVLRDGFAATEDAVQKTVARMRSGKRVEHQKAMLQLDRMIGHHGRDKKKAA